MTRCGSPEYMAPELHFGKPHHHPVDLWALGILAFELRNGSTPFFDERGLVAMAKRCESDPVVWKPEGATAGGGEEAGAPDEVRVAERSFVDALLAKKPKERLGALAGGGSDFGLVQAHSFFTGFSWTGLLERKLTPPFVPDLDDDRDVCNFEEHDDEEDDDNVALEGEARDGDDWTGF